MAPFWRPRRPGNRKKVDSDPVVAPSKMGTDSEAISIGCWRAWGEQKWPKVMECLLKMRFGGVEDKMDFGGGWGWIWEGSGVGFGRAEGPKRR